MLSVPINFPTQNSHRVALFQPDIAHADFDRIEDLTADAIAAARMAQTQLEQLPHAILKPVDGLIRTITSAVEQRSVLNDEFRNAAACIVQHLAGQDCSDEYADDLDLTMRYLRNALNLSHRVQDLLAAEREIGRYRGI